MIKVDYERAWKELTKEYGRFIIYFPGKIIPEPHRSLDDIMDELGEKHTHNYVDIRKRSDKEVADYCLKKHAELYIKYINLKNKLKKLLRELK